MKKWNKDNSSRQSQRGFFRKQYLIELKGGGCKKCGYNKCYRSLSFHHRDFKTKIFCLTARNIGNKKWEDVLNEFEKCDLLCLNCHGEHHDGEHHDGESNKDYIEYSMKLKGYQIKSCLNCGGKFKVKHSQLDVGVGKYCSEKCANVGRRKIANRPTKEQLAKMLWEKPTTHIAKQYGVSDNAVAKWAKIYELKKPPRGYWTKRQVAVI